MKKIRDIMDENGIEKRLLISGFYIVLALAALYFF